MSELFKNYEEEYSKLYNQIYKKVSNIGNQTIERKEAAISEAQNELNEAEKCLKQMEIEVSNLQPIIKNQLQPKLRNYRSEYEDIKKKFMRCEETYLDEKNKETLMGSRLEMANINHKERLLKTGDLMSSQNDKLKEGLNNITQAEDHAINIQKELFRNSETLNKAIDNTKQVNQEFSFSNNIINIMNRRILRRRVFFYLVFILMIIATIIIVYFKFIK